jgi:hemerythrin-like metal-binding protein
MTYLEWQSEFAVGHNQIDGDHQALLAAMNDLHAAADQGQEKAEIAKILNFLRDYTVTHFRMEEGLMIRHNYPEASAHFAAHADLVMEVSDFIADYRTGNIVGVPDMLHFLEKWLMVHIRTLDKDLGDYLKGRA